MFSSKRPHDKGMKKGLVYANVNARSRQYKNKIMSYLLKHFDIENMASCQKQMVAEKFEISTSTINGYIAELIERVNKYRLISANIPIDPRVLNNVIQSEAALTYNQALNLNLPLNDYQFDIEDGEHAMRLDFKVHGKVPKTINLFFVDCQTNKKYRLTQFAFNDKYEPKNGHVNLADPFLNGRIFNVSIYHNQKGYAVISEIELIL